jgi:hypothetical protein
MFVRFTTISATFHNTLTSKQYTPFHSVDCYCCLLNMAYFILKKHQQISGIKEQTELDSYYWHYAMWNETCYVWAMVAACHTCTYNFGELRRTRCGIRIRNHPDSDTKLRLFRSCSKHYIWTCTLRFSRLPDRHRRPMLSPITSEYDSAVQEKNY